MQNESISWAPPPRGGEEIEAFGPQLAPTISKPGPSLVKSPKGRFLIGIAAEWDASRGKGMPQMIILVVAPTKPRRSVNPDFDISYLRRRSEHNISRGERTMGREGRRRWNRQEGERRREFLGSFNNLASSFSDSYRRDYIPWINILTPIFVAGARATPRPTGKRNKLRAELLNHSRPRPYKRS